MPVKRKSCCDLSKHVFLAIGVIVAVLFLVQFWAFTPKQCQRGENVALIKLHGDIVTYGDGAEEGWYFVSSEKVVQLIEEADSSKRIKAIVLDIDSFGGSPVAGQEIANALKRVQKPTIALIRGAGDSAAYMAATGAKKIYATEFSEVGNIGITMSYLDFSQKNAAEGIFYQDLSSGPFKDIANPNKELTEEEQELLVNYIQSLKQTFVNLIAENRNLSKVKVEELADGSIMTSQDAKIRGLIDEVGTLQEVKDYLKEKFNIAPAICYFE